MGANPNTLTVQVPTLEEIAKMYQHAVSTKDNGLKNMAEMAITRLAVAEAAVAESATFLAFHSKVNK